MTADQVIKILNGLNAAGVDCWVMGGWGIDALLGEQTRAHHDLDLLVSASDLKRLNGFLRTEGFARTLEWAENDPVGVEDGLWDTAFVERHADGRQLDVHAVHVLQGEVRLATKDPWDLPPTPLDGAGVIARSAVDCVTASAQRAMHRGYVLSDEQRRDLSRLERA